MKPQRSQSGYVLLMVLSVIAVMALVIGRFAQRNDELRRNALDLQQYAEGQTAVAGGFAATLYWNTTRPLMPSGRGDAMAQLRQDGRPYKTQDGAFVMLQDARGLLSINGGSRSVLQSLLVQDGVSVERAQVMIAVLDDYIDTDNLKRINGAERAEYEALGLPGPRNDWLLSLKELEQMPHWRNDAARLARLLRSLYADIGHPFNPVTAPIPALRAMFPTEPPQVVERLLRLREQDQLTDLRRTNAILGWNLNDDDFILAPGNDTRITLWAPGLPRALEYNVRLTPAGELGPWVITEQHSTKRLKTSDEAPRAIAFPLAISAQRSEGDVVP